MTSSQIALQTLAAGVGCDDPSSLPGDRAAVEARLLPLVRCALRSGRGLPGLVSWVQQNLPRVLPATAGAAPDLEQVAPPLTRLLCSHLVERIRTAVERPDVRDTVVM